MRSFSLIKKFRLELISLGGALVVLWGMLLPGYVLSLDLVWTPHMPLVWNSDSLNNSYPVFAFFHYLSIVLPGWVGEKVLFVVLFFLLFYIPVRFLPWIELRIVRIFAAALFVLNPFVYARMLAGQWLVLFGYALIPLVLWSLMRFTKRPAAKTALQLGFVLAVLGMFSIHFLYLSMLLSGVWICAHIARNYFYRDITQARTTLVWSSVVLTLFLVLSSFWIVPSMFRHAPLEARFDTSHFEAFAAAPNGEIPTMLNVLALGGYWGEDTIWNLYFLWPQSQPIFWVAAFFVFLLILVGVYTAFKRPHMRFAATLLIGLGIVAYVTALGASETPFKVVNMFLYAHMPLWRGLRDSQKIAGLLALVYAVFAGVGAEVLLNKFFARKYIQYLAAVPLVAIVIATGMYEWRGFHGQLDPVWYPASWYQAKATLEHAPVGEKALVLPWHGYLSLDFAHHLIVSNPTPAFFGTSRVISSRSVDVGTVHDEEVDPSYREIDLLLSTTTPPDPLGLQKITHTKNIQFVLILRSTDEQPGANWTDNYSNINSNLESVDNLQGKKLLVPLVL